MTAELIVNHLWQSSCFALLAGLLAFMLREDSPKVRYWVWLSASLKFFVPWALLMSLGSAVPWPSHQIASAPATPTLPDSLVQMAEPFSPKPPLRPKPNASANPPGRNGAGEASCGSPDLSR